MIETGGRFDLLTQSASGSGEDENLTFSDLRLCSERHMKSVQFMTKFHSTIIFRFYYNRVFG